MNKRLSFRMFQNAGQALRSTATGSWWTPDEVSKGKALKSFFFFFAAEGQINKLK